MPYRLVLTKNGTNEEVSAVPEGWVVGTHLYWPRSLKKSDIESLRSNEYSIPDKSWKKMKCRLKLSDICSFKEALHLEDLYSKFQDAEDEEMYLNEHKNKIKQTTNLLSKQLLDVNSEFDVDENNGSQNEIKSEEVNSQLDNNITKIVANLDETNVEALSSDNQNNIEVILNDVPGTSSSNDEILTITTSNWYKIIQENNSLQNENKTLKEELLHSLEFQNETKKNFAIMQTQLDKVIELLQNKNRADDLGTTEDGINNIIIIDDLKFPIENKKQLDELEYKLLEKDVMTCLVKKFSKICGTSGLTRISKFGLLLMKSLIKDELLNQFTWKGIKGSTKIAFSPYVKIRQLFFELAHLADKSCSFKDSDLFIQNSAIKHSGQRIKRHILSSESKKNVKKTKTEISIEKDSNKIMISDAEIIDNVITEDEDKKITDGVNDNHEEKNYNTENNQGSETNKKSTDENSSDVNDENIGSLNTEKLQRSSIKKETGICKMSKKAF